MKTFRKLDLSQHTGRVFIVGDIHGAFSALEGQLKYDHAFDWEIDILLSVGDLVDRGPESHLVLDYLARPNFYAIAGNHEQMCVEAGGSSWHKQNGGKWFAKLRYYPNLARPDEYVAAFKKMPVLMEVLLPSGKRIGMAHASLPFDNWDENIANPEDHAEFIMWDRYRLGRSQSADAVGGEINIEGIDHVYYGHTPLAEPFTNGNQSWIDTGGVFGPPRKFTILELK